MNAHIKSPLPLAFDRVMEGLPVAAQNSALFKLPVEIITIIVSHLVDSHKDLASLALVNSDCRQLARSCQFRTVKLDFSPRSESILGILHREAIRRRQNRGYPCSSSLSACIRRVTANIDGYWKRVNDLCSRNLGRSIEDRIEDDYDYDDGDEDNEMRVAEDNEMRIAGDKMDRQLDDIYEPKLRFVISSLVHLESVEISQARWTQSFLDSLTGCTIKHLSLGDVEMTDIVPDMDDSVVWPLETLHIRLGWELKFENTQDPSEPMLNASNSWNTILRPCSQSLKDLSIYQNERRNTAIAFTLQFPQLRRLHLGSQSHLDESALQSLLLTSPHLSTLAINYAHRANREVLDRGGQIKSLETLALHNYGDIPDESSLRFFRENPQLKTIKFYHPEKTNFLERVLPLLATFYQLKELCMIWTRVQIPNSSLNALSSLISLEALHLSSGRQIGWLHDWFPCHNIIINFLKPLAKLRRIAFTRDTYSYPVEGQPFEYVYYVPLRHWELHLRCMHAQALTYAETFPYLNFIHIGKISFKISRANNKIELEATEDEMFCWRRRYWE